MKVCVDVRPSIWYADTGIGVYTYQLLKGLVFDDKNEYIFLLPLGIDMHKIGYDKFLLDESGKVKSNIKLVYISDNSKNADLDNEVLNVIVSNEVDIYHNTQNGIGMPRVKACKYIVTIHDVIPFALPEHVSETYLKNFMLNVPNAIYNSDMIITVSNYSKNDIINRLKVNEDKVKVIHLAAEDIYGVDNVEEAKLTMKYKYGINGDYILYVGGLNKRKNVSLLIKAYYKVYKEFEKDYKLVIAGKINEKNNYLVELVRQLRLEESVMFPGLIDKTDMPKLYNASTLFVYPSLYEGFGLPILEGMKSHIPIITSNVTSMPEIAFDAAMYFNSDDDIDLSNKIKQMINDIDLRKQYVVRGKEISDKYSFNKVIIDTMTCYAEVIR